MKVFTSKKLAYKERNEIESLKNGDILEGDHDLEEFKPIFFSQCIAIPISAEVFNTNKYQGDARSFGYPCDAGMCTEITYDFVMGVLAEDTIALAETIKKERKLLKEPDIDDMYERVLVDDNWKKGLDTQWLSNRIKEFIEKGLIEESEAQDEWDNDIDNYHCWSLEWKQAYDDANKKQNYINTTKANLVLHFRNDYIYESQGKFYSSNEYYNHGKTSLLDTDNIELAIKSVDAYHANVKALNVKYKKLGNKLDILKQSLLEEA